MVPYGTEYHKGRRIAWRDSTMRMERTESLKKPVLEWRPVGRRSRRRQRRGSWRGSEEYGDKKMEKTVNWKIRIELDQISQRHSVLGLSTVTNIFLLLILLCAMMCISNALTLTLTHKNNDVVCDSKYHDSFTSSTFFIYTSHRGHRICILLQYLTYNNKLNRRTSRNQESTSL